MLNSSQLLVGNQTEPYPDFAVGDLIDPYPDQLPWSPKVFLFQFETFEESTDLGKFWVGIQTNFTLIIRISWVFFEILIQQHFWIKVLLLMKLKTSELNLHLIGTPDLHRSFLTNIFGFTESSDLSFSFRSILKNLLSWEALRRNSRLALPRLLEFS